ncbi:hypothetical protein D3C87_1973640 [compost metagenome]
MAFTIPRRHLARKLRRCCRERPLRDARVDRIPVFRQVNHNNFADVTMLSQVFQERNIDWRADQHQMVNSMPLVGVVVGGLRCKQ